MFFIKSISEQGYSLPTAIADLIDNSVAAGATRIELLLDTKTAPLRFFIADNGCGMSSAELRANMCFPSADMDEQRAGHDLGRFGLGLKTGSFSQARRFTVVSARQNEPFEGCTWDLDHLKKTGKWTLLIEKDEAAYQYLEEYRKLSLSFHNSCATFEPRTLVIWDQLYKLERLSKSSEINDELDELRSHIGLVFHRFLESGKIQIRLNNSLIEGYDPFPVNAPGVQLVSESYWQTADTYIRFQGIILPKRAAIESKSPPSVWTAHGRTLDEMQGLFVYRNQRLISFGSWLRSRSKSIWLQFGRIKIDVTNGNDSEFHLNVAKSSLKLPFGLRRAMADMVDHVAKQAEKEYRERIAANIVRNTVQKKGLTLVLRENTAAGPVLRINREFDLLRQLESQLNAEQADMLRMITGLLENKLNQVWKGDNEVSPEIDGNMDDSQRQKILKLKKYYEQNGYSLEEIREFLLESFGQRSQVEAIVNHSN